MNGLTRALEGIATRLQASAVITGVAHCSEAWKKYSATANFLANASDLILRS